MKKNSGLTLVELVITIAILAIISVPAASILVNVFRAQAINKQLQEDQYNVRMALLAITRDLHDLSAEDKFESASPLTFTKKISGTDVKFTYAVSIVDGKNILQRTSDPTDQDTGINFVPVEIDELNVTSDGRFVKIEISCGGINPETDEYRTTVSTKISISRIPPKATPTPP